MCHIQIGDIVRVSWPYQANLNYVHQIGRAINLEKLGNDNYQVYVIFDKTRAVISFKADELEVIPLKSTDKKKTFFTKLLNLISGKGFNLI